MYFSYTFMVVYGLKKAISPLIVTVVVVAVVIAISIAYALWITSMTTSTIHQRSVKLEFYDAKVAIKTLILYIKNSGATETTVTHVIVNNQNAKIVWAWDLTDNKYLGYGEAPIKPGHMVEIAVKTDKFQFTPGVLVEFKVLTSSGITLYRTIELSAHPALSYIHGGFFNAWDYDDNKISLIYREFWIKGFDVRLTTYNVYAAADLYSIKYNLWYGAFQLGLKETIIHEIYMVDDLSSPTRYYYFDIKAMNNGTLVYEVYKYTSSTSTVIYSKTFPRITVLDPHRIMIVFKVSSNSVENFLYIDNNKMVDLDIPDIFGFYIVNNCFGIQDPRAIYEMYLDEVNETIAWVNGTPTITYENFDDLQTDFFTTYKVDSQPVYINPPLYRIILDNGKIGFVIDHT